VAQPSEPNGGRDAPGDARYDAPETIGAKPFDCGWLGADTTGGCVAGVEAG